MIEFYIPCVPVAKARARITVRSGFAHAYTPAKTKDYEKLVQVYARQAIKKPLEGPLCIDLVFTMLIPASTSKKLAKTLLNAPHQKKPDLDNLVKNVTDSLNGLAYADDSQIAEMRARKIYGENPGVLVSISAFNV